jgi:hypothetical protein
VAFYGIFSQRRYRASQESINFTQSDSTNVADALKLKQEYKSDLKDMRDQLDRERTARYLVESELTEAREMIVDLQNKYAKSEAAMNSLAEQFSRDALLRANVEKALEISNQKIVELTQRVAALEDERDKLSEQLKERDRLIEKLEAEKNQRSGFGGKS